MEKEEWIKQAKYVYEGYTKIDYEMLPDPVLVLNVSPDKGLKTVAKPIVKPGSNQKSTL